MPVGFSAWTPLANLTLGSNAATVTFSSISGSYRDLVLVAWFSATGNDYLSCRFNSDTGSNYNYVTGSGDGAGSTAATVLNNGTQMTLAQYSLAGTSWYPNSIIQVMDYSATDKHKTVLAQLGNSATGVDITAGRWANTSAITTMQMRLQSGNSFQAGSTFALYGVSS